MTILQNKKNVLLALLGLVSLGGCQSPEFSHYHHSDNIAPDYDAVIYMPKNSPEFYDHHYYHYEARARE
ncbi:MAG: hypothetical protein K2Y18_02590 [Alphaproteobacteria bacterium]|jgi:hypothetical protein|nr:hypothetical protein [Alphaproteobacteria bacterium]